MKISEKDIRKAAALSMLGLDGDEETMLMHDMELISEFADMLEKSEAACGADSFRDNLSAAEPLEKSARPDEPAEPFCRDDILSAAPETEDGFFVVPRVVE